MKKTLYRHLVDDLEMEYEYYPRTFWLAFLMGAFVFFVGQSWVAEPRSIGRLVNDVWDMALIFFPLIYIFWSTKTRDLLIFGLTLIATSIFMWFGFFTFIKPAYGTLMFVTAIWLLGEWRNIKKYKKSILTELLGGNYRIAWGIFVSTVVVGAVVELANAPFRVWWYQWPFPSILVMGLPIHFVVFGWLPWVMAMFVFFYPAAFLKPKKFPRHQI